MTLQIQDNQYTYGFHVLHNKIVKEYLLRKQKRRTVLFTRDTTVSIKNKSLFKGVSNLLEQLRDDVLFLKFAYFLNNDVAKEIVSFFDRMMFDNDTRFPYHLIQPGEEKINQLALRLMKYADPTVEDIVLRKNKETNEKRLVLRRYTYTSQWDKDREFEVDFKDFSSRGSARMYQILRVICFVLEQGGVFVADEIHQHLHPLLTRELIRLFHSPVHNPKNAQLVCTTHEILLLDEDIRRDQIWFIEKDRAGRSTLYSLADFKNIRVEDVNWKKYLLGMYGAVPEIDEF